MPSYICRTVIFRPDVFDAWSNGIPRSKNQAGEIRIGNPPLDTLPIYGIGFKLALCQSLDGRNKCVNSFHENAGECQAYSFIFCLFLFFGSSSSILIFPNFSHSANPPLSPPFH